MSSVDEKTLPSGPPRPSRLERLQRTDSDFHKVMNDFEQLMAATATGQLQRGSNPATAHPSNESSAVVPEPSTLAPLRQLPNGGVVARRTASEIAYQLRMDSALEAKYFSAGANFAPVATPPISAGGQSMASRGSSSDSSVGGSAQRIRSLPPLSYTSSSLGVESTAAARLRQRVSPRPNSVPLHAPDTLVVLGDDERPATTHDLVSSSAMEQQSLESLLMPKMSAQQEELRREMSEIDELRRKRDEDRLRRQVEREERRKQRAAGDDVSNVWQQARASASPRSHEEKNENSTQSAGGGETSAAALSPAEEAARRLKIQQAVLIGLVDVEGTSRNKIWNSYSEFVAIALSRLEELAVLEQSEHRIRIRRILEQDAVSSYREEERRRYRVLDIVRDCVRDETDARLQIESNQAARFLAATRDFVSVLESPLFSLVVNERLERDEWALSVEDEMFCFIQQASLIDLERIGRHEIERMCSRLAVLTLAEPIAVFNKSVSLLRSEAEKRRLLRLMCEDEASALWEWFCEELVPRLDRQMWHTIVRETNERLDIERNEREDAEVCFHGSKSIRPLVARYADALEKSRREWRLSAQRSFARCFEDELSSRALLQQSQREEHIFLQEQHRREEERLLALMRVEKKRAVEEAMAAAKKLRDQEEAYLKKQLKSLAAKPSSKK